MTLRPLYHLPHEDAPMSEWCRPISALLVTRRTSFFSNNARSNSHGALTLKFRKIAKPPRKERKKIDDATVCKMRDQGVRVAVIADRLGIGTGPIYRVLARVKARSDVGMF